jgi:glycosyltransferase involved in cell wall biosynthesis
VHPESENVVKALKRLTPAARLDLDPAGPRVSVVVPVKNEERNLPWLAGHMPAGVEEIILVDGNSVDRTVAVARELWPDVRVVHQTRKGKGNALACGFHAARGDIIVMIDADGSMDPGEIPYFVAALVDGADYAKGSRFMVGGGSSDITRIRAAGNRGLNLLTNRVHRAAFSDLCYGFNAFWRAVLPALELSPGPADGMSRWGDGFEIETLMNIRAHAAGLGVQEVASFESERIYGQSNLRATSDGIRVLRTIAVEAWRRTKGNGPAIRLDLIGQAQGSISPILARSLQGDLLRSESLQEVTPGVGGALVLDPSVDADAMFTASGEASA